MGSRVVKQPNGKYARFSEVVDDFTHLNFTHDEMMELLSNDWGKEYAKDKIERAEQELSFDGNSGKPLARWNEAMRIVKTIHGEERCTEILQELCDPCTLCHAPIERGAELYATGTDEDAGPYCSTECRDKAENKMNGGGE